jgi:hypothetical protein
MNECLLRVQTEFTWMNKLYLRVSFFSLLNDLESKVLLRTRGLIMEATSLLGVTEYRPLIEVSILLSG